MEAVAITTFDNPYDPFTEFNLWFLYDESQGYHTCSYLDRVAKTSDHYTDEQNKEIIEEAIDQIIKFDFRNIYKKVRMTKN